MPFKKRVLAGNWKMNGTFDQLTELDRVAAASAGYTTLTMLLCLPATLITRAQARLGSGTLELGGQDCHAEQSGAHTGDVSAEMLRDAGAHYVIVGHSERRADHGETSAAVRAKAEAAWRAGITAIICIGETRAEREAGATLDVVAEQLAGSVPPGARAANTIVAYEPVWAIGTGLTPTAADVARAHAHIRARLQELVGNEAGAVRILYGGSVKAANAAELMALDDVDGALVGGASLKAEDFLGIADAF